MIDSQPAGARRGLRFSIIALSQYMIGSVKQQLSFTFARLFVSSTPAETVTPSQGIVPAGLASRFTCRAIGVVRFTLARYGWAVPQVATKKPARQPGRRPGGFTRPRTVKGADGSWVRLSPSLLAAGRKLPTSAPGIPDEAQDRLHWLWYLFPSNELTLRYLREIIAVSGTRRRACAYLRLPARTVGLWLSGKRRTTIAPRSLIWLTWCLLLHPDRIRTVFDLATWGRFRVKPEAKPDPEDYSI
jgi:hypothetical protein